MWTYLPQWLVQDGQVDELTPGSSLLSTGVAATCTKVKIADGSRSAGVVLAESGVPYGYRYDVTGVAGAVRDVLAGNGDGRSARIGSEFLLTSGSLRFLASTTNIFVDEVAGLTVTVRCSLHVLADYEFEAFDLPDVRADWSVGSVQIERRALIRHMVKGRKGRRVAEGYAGEVVELIEVPRIRKWADDPIVDPQSNAAETVLDYVVDLRLLGPAIE